MHHLRQPAADSTRPHRLLNKALVPALLATLMAAAGLTLLGNTPAAAQSVPLTPNLLWMNGGHAGGSGRAALSPDGQVLATADYSEVYLWRYSDGRLLRTFGASYVDSIKCIKFTPDGRYVIAGGTWIPGSPNVSTLRMWHVSDGSPVRDFAATRDVRSFALSADGSVLAASVGGGEPTVTLFDVATGHALRSLGDFSANAVAFSRDGFVAAAGAVQFGDPPSVRIWRASDGLQLFNLSGLNFITDAVAFSPDGRYLAAGDWGGNGTPAKVQVWLAPLFVPVQSFTPYDGPNGSLAFTPDSQSIAAAGNGGVNIWHLPDGLLTKVVPVTTGEATWNLIFPDNLTLFASGAWNRAGVWRVLDGAHLRSVGNNREFVTSTAFSPDSAHLVVSNSVGPDETKGQGVGGVEMLRASDGAHVRTFTKHNDIVNSVAFSPDGTRVASGSGSPPPDTRDTRIIISSSTGTGAPLVLPGHAGGTRSVAFSPDSRLLASGGVDRVVRLWRVSDGSAVRALSGHANWVNSVAFSPDGQLLASAGDVTVRLWRVSDGQPVRTIQPDGYPVGSVAFSPDGQTIASTTYNGVQLWRASDGQSLRSLNVTAGYVNVGGVAFSADGSLVSVANGSYPPRVWFWRVSDGAVVTTYDRETGWVQPPSLAFSPDGTMLAIGRYDSHVEVVRPPAATTEPSPTPTPAPTATATPTPTPVPTPSATPSPEPTPIPTPTPVATPTPAPTPVRLEVSEDFLTQHYRDFLNREPDAEGLAFWANEIESCGADAACREVRRVNVSAAFFLSIEFQQTGFLAYRARKAAFGNTPGKPVPISRAEMLADMQVVASGLVVGRSGWQQKLEQNKQAYFERLVASERFNSAYPQTLTPAQFVDALNRNAGGALSAAEWVALVDDLTAQAKTRAQALRAVAEDPDFNAAERNKAFVLMQYFGYLRRDPDAAPDSNFDGYDYWLNKLDSFDGDFVSAEMVKAFIVSNEYRNRFAQ